MVSRRMALCLALLATDVATVARAAQPVATDTAATDTEFLEFLGADDVDDEKWWDYFSKSEDRDDNDETSSQRESQP
jgi:hypothetical protein